MTINLSTQLKFILIIGLLFSSQNMASAIHRFETLSSIDSRLLGQTVDVPLVVLNEAYYTTNEDIYRAGDLCFRVIDTVDGRSIRIRATRGALPYDLNQKQAHTSEPLPWWPSSTLPLLKHLDFSNVLGTESQYQVGHNYSLRKLPEQGAWGPVYALEHLRSDGQVEIIAAAKVLVTQSNSKRKTVSQFRERHLQEIANIQAIEAWDIAARPLGIIKNDEDHYIAIFEYGRPYKSIIKNQNRTVTHQQLLSLIRMAERMHLSGFAHGDLKLDNVLIIDGKLVLCDWFSLKDIRTLQVGSYRYDGDNLPPEAIRAFYFDKQKSTKRLLTYADVLVDDKQKFYWLHPILADRFCLGISLLEIIAPDLYQAFEAALPKDFSPWNPSSLNFWKPYIDAIERTQEELLARERASRDLNEKKLFSTAREYIHVDPLKRLSPAA